MEINRSRSTSKHGSQKNGNSLVENYLQQNLDVIKKKVEQDIRLNLKKDLDQILKSHLGRSNFEIKKMQKSICQLEENDQLKPFDSEIKKLEKTISELEENDQWLKSAYNLLNIRIDKLRNYKTISIKVKLVDKIKDLGVQHYQFEKLLKYVQTKNNIFLVGSAGSGKTTAAKNIAKALGLQFYFTGAITNEFKLTGFMNAHGKIVSTDFRKAYEEGGVFLFDEIDASFPQAILAFNAALANDFMDFPDGRVEKHKDFYCIAAANTYGTGADRQYVGRNQLDAASLDRFILMSWDIDENLERQLAKNDVWTDYVQKVRKAVDKINERIIISPRASIIGAELLKVGISRQDVENDILWKGLEASRIQMIKNNINVR